MLSAVVMIVGATITLASSVIAIVIGLVVMTTGFFGAHAIASGWVGARAQVGRAQASSLYNLFYYSGSSGLGWAGGMVFAGWGWAGMTGMVIGLTVTAIALTALGGRRLRSSRVEAA
jgi:predicted MFS family arabinose efflux permease